MSISVNLLARRLVDGAARLETLLLPPRCLVCEAPGRPGLDLCTACHDALPWLGAACPGCAEPMPGAGAGAGGRARVRCDQCLQTPWPLDTVLAALRYAPPVDRLLPRFKFHQDLAAGRVLAALMAAAIGDRLGPALHPTVLVPVPLHRSRLRARGYDQAAQLSGLLARQLGLPRQSLLRRVVATAPQSELDAPARRCNLRGAFACRRTPPPHVVLVDDVMTTGATLRAAAGALRRAGAQRVDAWVCARAVRDN